MPIQMTAVIILMYALIFALYIPVLTRIRVRRRTQATASRFCRGVVSILEATPADQVAYPQVRTLHKTLVSKYSVGDSREFGSVTSALENLLTQLDSSPGDDFLHETGVRPPTALRSRLVTMLDMARIDEPFADLTSKQAHLLTTLSNAVKSGNSALATTAISQLSDEVGALEDGLARQKTQIQVGFILSAVGIVLTLFFGTVSFVQFFAK